MFNGARTVSVAVVKRVIIVRKSVSKCDFVWQIFLIDWGDERHSLNTFSFSNSPYTHLTLTLESLSLYTI